MSSHERPKGGPRAVKSGQEQPKSGQEHPKSGSRAAKSAPRVGKVMVCHWFYNGFVNIVFFPKIALGDHF